MPRSHPDARFRTLTFTAGLAAMLAGCTPAAKPHSTATPPPPADPVLQKVQAECADVAARATENVSPQGQASKAALGIYFKCMSDKGFPQKQ